jgi:hypothetical protein
LLLKKNLKRKNEILWDGYNYKKTMTGIVLIQAFLDIGDLQLTYNDAKEFASLFLKNSLITEVPYNPISEFAEEKYYCFTVFILFNISDKIFQKRF